jgi:hypothetical protein
MIGTKRVFKKVEVIPEWVNGHFVQWQLDPFFKAPRPYNFSLQISETDNFSDILREKLNLGDIFFAVDDFKLKQSAGGFYYYRVQLTTGDGKKYSSQPIMFGYNKQEQRKYAMAADGIRKEILLCRYAGTQAWLLRRKTYSAPSTVTSKNIDPVSGAPISDTQHEDYGVGIDGGYFDPVPCMYHIESSSQDKQLSPDGIGVKETYAFNIRAPGYPMLEIRDVLCDINGGLRYSIQARNSKNFPGTSITLFQKATIMQIPSTDTVYSIPIPIAT